MTIGLLSFGRSGILAAPTGKALLNGFHSNAQPFKNFIKAVGIEMTPGTVDANGYPNIGLAASNVGGFPLQFSGAYRGSYYTAWTGNMRWSMGGMLIRIFSGGAFAFIGGNSGYNINAFFGGAMNGTTDVVHWDFSQAITGIANNGSGAVRITMQFTGPLGTAGTTSFTPTVISGVTGTGAANVNGTWSYTIIDATTVDLVGSTFTGTPSGGNFQYFPTDIIQTQFASGGTFSGFSDFIVCRADAPYTNDLADIRGGVLSNQFNQDFINSQIALNSHALRLMDVSGVNGAPNSQAAHVTPLGCISYMTGRWMQSLWCGTTSTSGFAYSVAASPTTPGTWTAGEAFQCTIGTGIAPISVTNATAGASNGLGGNLIRLTVDATNMTTGQRVSVRGYNDFSGPGIGGGTWTITKISSTQIDLATNLAGAPSTFSFTYSFGGNVSLTTIDCGTRGPKLLVGAAGDSMDVFHTHPTTGDNITCVYDAIMDVVLTYWAGAGITLNWPIEVRVALANKVNQNLWHNFPMMYAIEPGLASVASETAYIKANLNSNLSCYFELDNEPWNTTFVSYLIQAAWASMMGLGGTANMQGLNFRRVMEQVTTSWGGVSPRLRRVLAWQGADGGLISQTKALLFDGAGLTAGVSAAYNTFTGSATYSSPSTNTPAAFCDYVSYATYFSGTLGAGGFNTGAFNAVDASFMTAAADNYALGTTPGIAAAFDWMDRDIKFGTFAKQAVTASGDTFTTVAAHGYVVGSRVGLTPANGATLWTGTSEGIYYFVVATPTTTTFKISAISSVGSPITVSGGSGTLYVGTHHEDTLLWFKIAPDQYHTAYNTLANLYSPAKGIICYEGGFEESTLGGLNSPDLGNQCAAIGISNSYGGSGSRYGLTGGLVWNMLVAYKHSSNFQTLVSQYCTDMVGVSPGSYPAWYTYGANGTGNFPSYPWSLVPTFEDATPFFTSYDALAFFNTH